MLTENTVAKIFESGLQQGADFTEVFVEDSVSSSINLLDQKIDEINSSNSFGIGIRLLHGNEAYYGYSSDPEEKNLLQLTKNLGQLLRQVLHENTLTRLDISPTNLQESRVLK